MAQKVRIEREFVVRMTGRGFLCVSVFVMSAVMPLPGLTHPATAAQVAESRASRTAQEPPVLRDVQEETMAAAHGTPFVITRAVVHVPEVRGAAGGPSRSIELAVVRARRVQAADANRAAVAGANRAHFLLAGGPGDSGIALVLNAVQRGGAAFNDLFDGDIVGIDQRGTGKSSPNLSSSACYGLPLDRAGSPDAWLPLMSSAAADVAADFRARGIRLESYR